MNKHAENALRKQLARSGSPSGPVATRKNDARSFGRQVAKETFQKYVVTSTKKSTPRKSP